MRRIFLWAARNRWLKERLPRMRFMRRAVRRFMPGETLGDALAAAAPLQAVGIAHDVHAARREPRRDVAEADEVADHYVDVIDQIVAAGIDGEVSVKPTQLGLDLDPEVCFGHLVRDRRARRRRPARTCGSTWSRAPYVRGHDRALRAPPRGPAADRDLPAGLPASDGRRPRAAAAARSGDPAGQGRLRRAGDDRLHEPPQRRRELPRAGGRASCSRAAAGRSGWAWARTTWRSSSRSPSRSAAAGIGLDGFEVEMLYGIREDQQRRLAKAGYRVQSLIAYGEHWYPWYMRRLAERPANMFFALRQLIP